MENNIKELQLQAVQLFQADSRAMEAATKACKIANTNLTNATKEVEEAEAAYILAETGPSAKKVGEAFIAVREACRFANEGKAWGQFIRRFESSRNRVNYCIRVAEGKVGKEAAAARAKETAKKKPHLAVIKSVTNDLMILVRYAARFDRKNGDKLLDLIIGDVRKLYEDTYNAQKKKQEEFEALQVQLKEKEKAAEKLKRELSKKSAEARRTFKKVPFDVADDDKAAGASAGA